MRSYEEIFGNTIAHVAVSAKTQEYAIDAEIALAYKTNAVLEEELKNVEPAIKKVESGESNVPQEDLAGTLAWLVAERNHIERQLRANYAALFREYGYNKRNFRSMVVGYYVDDNGFAITKDGEPLGESQPGKFITDGRLAKLCPCNINSVEIKDQQGTTTICEIKRDNIPAIKEALANFDMPLCDQINMLYMCLCERKDQLLYSCADVIERTYAHLSHKKNAEWAGAMHKSPEQKAHFDEEQ